MRTRRRVVPRAGETGFSQGVASGEPSPRGITLWARVDDLEATSELQLEIARDRDFRRVVERRRVTAERGENFTLRERVGGLDPDERYFYRFFTGKSESAVGRFKTIVPADSRRPVRIGFFSCQDWESGYYTAHSGLAEEDVDLVFCVGDYVYERSFYEPKVRSDPTGHNGDGEVQTLGEYRDKYALYHSDENLRRVRRNHPMLALYDDHEVEENWGGRQSGDPTVEERRVAFERRRKNGLRAFFEHMPMTRDGLRRLYGSRRIGRNVELFMLNERLFRDKVYPIGATTCPGEVGDEATPDSDPDLSYTSRSRGGRPPAPRGSDGGPPTLLGDGQKRWFKRALQRSSATWKPVANPLMIMSLDLPRGQPVIDDQWDGFAEERREIAAHIRDRGIDNVAFFTGDIHTFFAGGVTPSGRQSSAPGEGPVATEFVCSSISSLGIADCFAQNNSEDLAVLLGDEAILRTEDPHITYSDVKHRGYGVMEARSDGLTVAFRAPESAYVPQSRTVTLKQFQVQPGTPRVEVV